MLFTDTFWYLQLLCVIFLNMHLCNTQKKIFSLIFHYKLECNISFKSENLKFTIALHSMKTKNISGLGNATMQVNVDLQTFNLNGMWL